MRNGFPFRIFSFKLVAMSRYEFVSVWTIEAPLELVWATIKDSEAWPSWWRGVVNVVELKPGSTNGLGAIHRSTWKSASPYILEFDSEIIRIEELKLIEARAFGELDGWGLWQFAAHGFRRPCSIRLARPNHKTLDEHRRSARPADIQMEPQRHHALGGRRLKEALSGRHLTAMLPLAYPDRSATIDFPTGR